MAAPRRFCALTLLSLGVFTSLLPACGGVAQTPQEVTGTAPPEAAEPEPEITNPVLEMLGRLPASAANDPQGVNYVNYEAALAARGLEPISAAQAHDDGLLSEWINAVSGTRSDTSLLTYGLDSEAMQAAVGFTIFDVRRETTFGQPPGPGVVLEGDFDAAHIEAALADRGFTAEQVVGLEVWCGPVGCDQGLDVNPEDRQPANPFGGRVGRQEPLFVSDTLLLNSADLSRLTEMLQAYQANGPGLADNPEYQALAEAASSLGTVIQMRLMPSDDYWLTVDAYDVLGEDAAEEDIEQLSEDFAAFGRLPEYTLWGIADIWDGEQQIAALLLVMQSREDAQAAAQELHTRLSTGVLPVHNLTFSELAADRGGALQPAAVYESGEHTVVIAMITYPPPAPAAEGELAEYPGVFYRLFHDLWARRQISLYLARNLDL